MDREGKAANAAYKEGLEFFSQHLYNEAKECFTTAFLTCDQGDIDKEKYKFFLDQTNQALSEKKAKKLRDETKEGAEEANKKGEEFMQQGRLTEAKETFLEAIAFLASDPDNFQRQTYQDNADKVAQKIKDDQQRLEKEKKENDETMKNAHKKGVEYYDQEKNEEALECFQEAFLTCDPESDDKSKYEQDMSKVKQKMKDMLKVQAEAEEANKKGMELMDQRQFKEALICFQQALSKCGVANEKRQLYEDAVNNTNQRIKEDEDKERAKQHEDKKAEDEYKKGEEYFNEGKFEDAKDCFAKAFLMSDPESPARQKYVLSKDKAQENFKREQQYDDTINDLHREDCKILKLDENATDEEVREAFLNITRNARFDSKALSTLNTSKMYHMVKTLFL